MSKIITVILAVFSMLFVGCDKSLPSPEKMESTSRAIGIAAGYVASQTKLDAEAKAAVVQIMSEGSKATPAKGQSFEEAWTPVAKEVVAKLVADGKLKNGQDALVLAAFGVATKALDYEFTVRYPKAREVTEVVASAVRGFTDGFLSTFNVRNTLKAAPADMDKEAYEYLTK